MGLRRFERRLENLVEGTFARVFKSGLSPLEIGRRIIREIDAHQTVSVDGATVVPNHYWVYISTADHHRFAEVQTPLTNELIEATRTHIADEGYRVLGPVSVTLVEAPGYPEGTLQVQPQWRESVRETRAALTMPDGTRHELGQQTFTIGRMPASDLVLSDPNVSRNHALIRPSDGQWILQDLDSTNGTTVNGAVISEVPLRSGDRIVFGAIPATFEIA